MNSYEVKITPYALEQMAEIRDYITLYITVAQSMFHGDFEQVCRKSRAVLPPLLSAPCTLQRTPCRMVEPTGMVPVSCHSINETPWYAPKSGFYKIRELDYVALQYAEMNYGGK